MTTPRDHRAETSAAAAAEPALDALPKKLKALQIELVELAFDLDLKGRLEAADVAMTTSTRLGELCEEVESRQTHAVRFEIPSVPRNARG